MKNKYRDGTFLWLAKETLGKKYKETLYSQYDEKGVKWMAKHWGYHEDTILRNLRKIGAPIKKRGNNKFWSSFERKVNELGGLNWLLQFPSANVMAKVVGFDPKTLCKYLRKNGYEYDGQNWVKRKEN